MDHINKWAHRWGLPEECLTELKRLLGVEPGRYAGDCGNIRTESGLQAWARAEAARRGARLWRNNSGACQDETGRIIRYGLGNDSKKVNDIFKSSDLIGVWPHKVSPVDVGRVLGVFTAIEVKAPGWRLQRSDTRGQAQFNFLQFVAKLGGYAKFITSENDL